MTISSLKVWRDADGTGYLSYLDEGYYGPEVLRTCKLNGRMLRNWVREELGKEGWLIAEWVDATPTRHAYPVVYRDRQPEVDRLKAEKEALQKRLEGLEAQLAQIAYTATRHKQN